MDLALLAANPVDASRVLVWVAALVVVVIAGGAIILLVRRRVLTKESSHASDAGLMDGLRGLRRSGQISDEEYDAIRRKMALRIRTQSARSETQIMPPGPGGSE